MAEEMAITMRTYNNVRKYLSIYDNVTELSEEKVREQVIVGSRITLHARDNEKKKNIIVCITKHDQKTIKSNSLINDLCTGLNLHSILTDDTDIIFVCYEEADLGKYIAKHKKKVSSLETELSKYPSYQAKGIKITTQYHSYNRFRYTLEEFIADKVVDYEAVENEEDVLTKLDIKKSQIPTLVRDDEPILILKRIEVGQLVREIMLNEACGKQITYKRVR
jgi:DNA-directed RNA polymerase subunit H (RpoH/RPB5)